MKAGKNEHSTKKIIISRNPATAYAQGKEAGRKEWEDERAGECTLQGMFYIKNLLRQMVFNVNDRSCEKNSNGNSQRDFMTRPQLKIFIDRLCDLCEKEIQDVIENKEEGISIEDKVDLMFHHDSIVKKLLNEAAEKQNKRVSKKGV